MKVVTDEEHQHRRTGLRRVAAAVLALATVVAVVAHPVPAAAAPSEVPDPTWVTNGRVWAVRQVGPFIYIGGKFSRVGPATGHGVEVDPDSGSRSASSPHVNGVVLAAVPDGNGGWFIGGNFGSVNGTGRTNVAHVLADGSVADWNPFTDRAVRAIAVVGDTVVLGGDFSAVRGTPRQNLAAVRADNGAVLQHWNPGTNGRVNALVAHPDGDEVFVGGEFTSAGGIPRSRAAAFDIASGDVAPLFSPTPNAAVRSLDISPDGNRLYLGGDFTFVGLVPRSRIAAVDATTGALDLTFGASANQSVHALRAHPDGQRVFVGGAFTRLAGAARNHLGAVDLAGALLPWRPFATGSVESIALSPDGTSAVVGGFFGSLDQTPAAFVGRVSLDGTGTPLATFDVQPDGVVRAVAWADDGVFLGGGFASVGSVRQPRLARLHADTGELDTSWTPTVNDFVLDLEPSEDGSELYVAGRFTTVNGQPRGHGASFRLPSGNLTSWDPGANGEINAVEPSGSHVYVGGSFGDLAGGSLHRFVGRTDPATGEADPFWQPLPSDRVSDIVVDPTDSLVYLGGTFRFIGLVPRQNIAAVNSMGVPTGWNPGSDTSVLRLDLTSNGTSLFAAQGGTPSDGGNAITAYDTAGSGSIRWKHQGTGDVQAVMVAPDSTVYVGGHFRRIRASNDLRTGIAAFDGPTGALKPFAPLLSWSDLGVWGIDVADDGSVLVGGDHNRVGAVAQAGLARFPDQP